MLKLTGLSPTGVRHLGGEARLQWHLDGQTIETDFDRFRPVALKPKPGARSFDVTWRDFGDLALNDPFFKITIDKAGALPIASQPFQTARDTLSLVAGQPDVLPLSGVVFHMARTGSTLIHRLLGRIAQVQSLSEVTLFDRVLFLTEGWPAEERNIAVNELVAAFRRPRRPNERFFVTKMTDAMASLRLPLFRAAFPTVPWVFVYREPVEVMVSTLLRPTGNLDGWYRNRAQAAGRLGMPIVDDSAMWPEEFVARTLRRFCTRAVEAARATPPGLFLAVPYSRLPDAVWETIAPHFGIELTERDRETMRAEARYSAKKTDPTEFRPDSAAKQDEATPFMKSLANRLVGPVIEELRALPQA